MSAARANKRRRNEGDHISADEGEDEPAEPYTKGDVWLDDGNIILVADDNVAFRVLKSVLARDSEVFRNMFTVSQPTENETFEGCPVVVLADSSTIPTESALLDCIINYKEYVVGDTAVEA